MWFSLCFGVLGGLVFLCLGVCGCFGLVVFGGWWLFSWLVLVCVVGVLQVLWRASGGLGGFGCFG